MSDTEFRVRHLSRRVKIDPIHKARLREELLRRHRELNAVNRHTQRAAFRLWPHVTRLKRLTLVAPPALAVAAALSIGIFALQVSGHQKTQTVEAARITQAFARAVPSITSWRWMLHVTKDGRSRSMQFGASLNRDQALRFYYNGPYLYYRGHWSAVEWDMQRMAAPVKPTEWEWAFAILPSLVSPHARPLSGPAIEGRAAEGFSRATTVAGARTTVTAWVDRENGLVLRLDRKVSRGGQTLERDIVDYSYPPRSK